MAENAEQKENNGAEQADRETEIGGKALSKGKKTALIVVGAVVGLLLIGLIVVLSIFHFEKDKRDDYPENYTEMESQESVSNSRGDVADSFDLLEEVKGNDTLSAILKDWANDSDENKIMHADNVTNVLLMGIDNTGVNSDVIMLASINEDKKTIFLTSIMRDSYTYIKTDHSEGFGKINSAYGNGGADCLVQTVQNDFKIRVDYYVSVNFDSFSSIVDSIGGVEVPVMEYEAYAMGNLNEYGENVRLNGEQALMYCRIRKSDADGDVSRTRRQKQFISALIKRCKTLESSQLKEVISTLMQYVKTDCPATKIIRYGTKAMLNKWYDYDIIPLTIPTPDFRMDYLGYAWVWIVDYPPLAQYLQDTIYGSSNIVLRAGRVSAIDVMKEQNVGEATP